MSTRLAIQFLLLLTGFTLLAYHERFPHWFFYALMLAVLGAAYYLAPEWFEGRTLRFIWWAGVGVATIGLVLELVSQYLT